LGVQISDDNLHNLPLRLIPSDSDILAAKLSGCDLIMK
jgi:hypothetical protein